MKKQIPTTLIGWVSFGIFLYLWQEKNLSYHYAYIEQFRLFHANADYFTELCSRPLGIMEYSASFIIQFFNQPHIGALVITGLFLLIGIGVQNICKKILPKADLPIIYVLPLFLLLFAGMDFNYHLEGTLAFALTVGLLNLHIRIVSEKIRIGSAAVFSWLVFYVAGPAFVVYTLCVVIYEWNIHSTIRWHSLFLVPFSFLPAFYCYLNNLGVVRTLFLPDAYTNPRLEQQKILYYVWTILPVLLGFVCIMRLIKIFIRTWLRHLLTLFQIILSVYIFIQGCQIFNQEKNNIVKAIDYHYKRQEWDKILEMPLRADQNKLLACYQNLALAQKGILADKALCYKQSGSEGLWIEWKPSVHVCVLLSDLYYKIGHIALAQRYAFEGIVASEWSVNPYLQLRLIQTNLIYGNYEVAHKYIENLADTRYARKANEFRRFLYNDDAIEQDPELGEKRRNIKNVEGLSEMNGLPNDLLQIANSNPSNRTVLSYIGMYILFQKDIPMFRHFLQTFHQSEGLHPLPTHFLEAVILSYEADTEKWEEYGVTEQVKKRFEEFKKITLGTKKNPTLYNKLRASYGNTYWFYYIYHQ